MEYNFSISPRIISHLGEELIKNESIALLELVKNSYDACATKCIIEFNTDQNGDLESIIIEDDGRGMDQDLIKTVWLTIGTDNKFKSKGVNECGRFPLGEKGIGRLGIHKLGNRIEMYSKQSNSNETKVEIDWTALNNVLKIKDSN
jgi:DNA topoisomerase VI subunit B